MSSSAPMTRHQVIPTESAFSREAAVVSPGPPSRSLRYLQSLQLRPVSHRLIPGGCHTYAKADDQFPEDAPSFIERGLGCRVWDCDGNEFIEYGAGLRAVTLGHAFPPVIEAAARQMTLGLNFVRPALIEITLAERFLEFVKQPNNMVKFAKNGSDCTTAAIKLARAYTGRDMVAVCGDQPFFSTDDWFIGSTTLNAGIPKAIQDLTVKFRYNDIASLERLFESHPGKIAAIILEPATSEGPVAGFLSDAKALCHKHGAVFILDESITGFRYRQNSAQLLYGVQGDLSIWAKAIGNGFAIAALVGERDIMELGGLHDGDNRVFLLSTTHGAETHCMAACLAVMDAYDALDVTETLHRQGEKLKTRARELIGAHGLSDHVDVVGPGGNLIYLTKDRDGNRSQVFRTLFMQEMIAHGVLGPSFVNNIAHDDDTIAMTLDALDETLVVYAKAIEGNPERFLAGRPVRPVFRQPR